MTRMMRAALVSLTMATPVLAENRIDQIRPDAPELAAHGDHVVGVTTRTFSNPDQIDVLKSTADALATYTRDLTVEIWYPAADGTTPGGTYTAPLRDPSVQVTLHGQAARDADPASGETFPLVVISHGYPGNRFLLSHLGENLASKGYVVASIDHTDSTYSDQAAFGSTLLNRPIDQKFVIDSMAALDGPIGAITDASTTGVIGYSMGGYGALIFGGAGLVAGVEASPFAPPKGALIHNVAGTDTHEALVDERVKAMIVIGPWGRNYGLWDDAGLAGLRKPTMLMAGSVDDVSVYDAIRQIFINSTGTDRHLLTFENANHNAAAPMASPEEGWAISEALGFPAFEHYADAVWDNTRMNNITQHFSTAFLDIHLKADADKAAYLDLVPSSNDGVFSAEDNGTLKDDHTYWAGFPARTAVGLKFETLKKGE
ncbi:alpha/beta hydrolase family protein [Shimia sp. Alg240-R146]|uniref:alpha/beta hydrolase family protein n=1 Tax=Shimia sp. Alg240-R146 TaxID=2993449 RepID=UPI0022DFBF9D|nr:dienelactone hydrolase [Shimia sp. Alg240-R146]